MNPVDESRAEIALLQQRVRELEQAEALIRDALPKARQALEAAQGSLLRLQWRDAKARRDARARELETLQRQLSEARS